MHDSLSVLLTSSICLCDRAPLPPSYFTYLPNFDAFVPLEGRELVRILLAAGADPTAQDVQHRQTALHTAAMSNDVELVKVSEVASSL